MEKISRPSCELYSDWSALEFFDAIWQKNRMISSDLIRISTGQIYNFPALTNKDMQSRERVLGRVRNILLMASKHETKYFMLF